MREMAKSGAGSALPLKGSYGALFRSSVHRAGRCVVRELQDGIGDPAPGHGAVIIAGGRELVSSSGTLLGRLIAVALEHELRCPPDIDLGYHATNTAGLRSRNV